MHARRTVGAPAHRRRHRGHERARCADRRRPRHRSSARRRGTSRRGRRPAVPAAAARARGWRPASPRSGPRPTHRPVQQPGEIGDDHVFGVDLAFGPERAAHRGHHHPHLVGFQPERLGQVRHGGGAGPGGTPTRSARRRPRDARAPPAPPVTWATAVAAGIRPRRRPGLRRTRRRRARRSPPPARCWRARRRDGDRGRETARGRRRPGPGPRRSAAAGGPPRCRSAPRRPRPAPAAPPPPRRSARRRNARCLWRGRAGPAPLPVASRPADAGRAGRSGRSAADHAPTTPGTSRAAETRAPRNRPCATGLRANATSTVPGSRRSATVTARPVRRS